MNGAIFRGIDRESNGFKYGYHTKLIEEGRRIDAIVSPDNEDGLTRWYIHSKETISQYTGLTNHNGVEIWFDDVWYIAGYGNLHVKDVGDLATVLDALAEGDVERCLGNIHQNPELLED